VTTFRQSFAWWSFALGQDEATAPALLRAAAEIGYRGVEMLPETLWPRALDLGLELVALTGHDIPIGFNDPDNRDSMGEAVRRSIDSAAGVGIPFVIVFSGNRGRFDDETAIGHCADGLAPLAEAAHAAGVTLVLELRRLRGSARVSVRERVVQRPSLQ
jgi:hydroxypyruvate isomerase